MGKKLFFFVLLFQVFWSPLIYSKEKNITGLSTCKSSNLDSPIISYDNINLTLIKIDVEKYRKWSKNNIKIITTPGRHILEKYKKRFQSKITFYFDNNTNCVFNAKIRQSGDEKDHIGLDGNSVIQSLDVQLLDGNIKGITKFKLFKSNSRGNHTDEIIQTQLLRNLGYLAPRSINTIVDLNGIKTEMLLQEKAAKELLEYNNRREGPILEGDESFFWKVANSIPDDNRSNWDVGLPYLLNKSVKTMLVKSTNASLVERSEKHLEMFLNSINELNKVYLYWGNRFQDKENNFFYFDYDLDNFLLSLNNDENLTRLEIYNFLMQSTNSHHGLAVPNRKFYWNSIEKFYEPINYDSNPNIDFNAPTTSSSNPRFPISKDYLSSIKKLEEKLNNIDVNILHNQIINSGVRISKNETIQKINKIIKNLDIIKKNYINNTNDEAISYNKFKEIENIYTNFNKNLDDINPDTYIINYNKIDGQFYKCKLYFKDCKIFLLKPIDVSKLLEGELLIENKYYKYLNNDLNLSERVNDNYNLKQIFDTKIFYENGIELIININDRSINIIQKKEGDKIYFLGGELSNFKINFQGLGINKFNENKKTKYVPKNFPINQDGLTGCLSFINTKLDNANFYASNSNCEDSINLINVSGNINEIKITNSFSDSLDIDFSNLSINKVEIENSGNDCTDFSSGIYNVNYMILKKCGDKGISVGEKSKFNAKTIYVDEAIIGVASKDSSITNIDESYLNIVDTCVASYNKKQEFFGGFLEIKNLECLKYKIMSEVDSLSKINIINK